MHRLHPPAKEPADDPAPVSEPVGRPRSGRRRGHRDRGARVDLPERGLSAGGLRRGCLLPARDPVLRGRGSEPPRPLT
jgi:hypothetical protein